MTRIYKEHEMEYRKAYFSIYKNEYVMYSRRWYEKNKNRKISYSVEYNKTHPEKHRINCQNYENSEKGKNTRKKCKVKFKLNHPNYNKEYYINNKQHMRELVKQNYIKHLLNPEDR